MKHYRYLSFQSLRKKRKTTLQDKSECSLSEKGIMHLMGTIYQPQATGYTP
jgi:hypothetical protein